MCSSCPEVPFGVEKWAKTVKDPKVFLQSRHLKKPQEITKSMCGAIN